MYMPMMEDVRHLHDSLMAWRFPGATCEEPCDSCMFGRQPVSTFIDFFCTAEMLVTMLRARRDGKSWATCAAVLSLAFFEGTHAAAHAGGALPGMWAHISLYVMCMACACALGKQVGLPKSQLWQAAVAGTVAVDVGLVIFLEAITLYSVFCGLGLLALVVFGYVPLLNSASKKTFVWLCGGLVLLSVLLLNDASNCEAMLASSVPAPHALVEVVGSCLFSLLARFILAADAPSKKGL
eukprot:TRINITY_DN79114_c0_g1_i1.p1 TRINITY_DN79114_c0_g1~~TRINITY_DN79114_c0_g1_i1.p1  ORF type:complete len:238 (-),score=37.62 TRINITY_DN79114_c0_g1_i1:341-1054(-)